MIGVDQIINNQTMVPAGEWSSSKTHTVSMRWPRIGTKAHTKNSSELAIHPRFPDIELLLFTHLFQYSVYSTIDPLPWFWPSLPHLSFVWYGQFVAEPRIAHTTRF